MVQKERKNNSAKTRRIISKKVSDINRKKEEYLKWLYANYTVSKILGLEDGLEWHINKVFVVDENRKVVLFGKSEITFDKIINVELRTETSHYTITKTEKDDALGKAVVGGIIAGNVGTIVGASMANETSKSNTYSTETINGLSVYLKDVSHPMYEYEFCNSDICRDIYATLLAIIKLNQ